MVNSESPSTTSHKRKRDSSEEPDSKEPSSKEEDLDDETDQSHQESTDYTNRRSICQLQDLLEEMKALPESNERSANCIDQNNLEDILEMAERFIEGLIRSGLKRAESNPPKNQEVARALSSFMGPSGEAEVKKLVATVTNTMLALGEVNDEDVLRRNAEPVIIDLIVNPREEERRAGLEKLFRFNSAFCCTPNSTLTSIDSPTKRHLPSTMSSGGDTPQETLINRKRAAKPNADVPPSKRHRSDAAEQLLETMKFQNQQIEQAINIWVRLKGGEAKLGDANTNFLSIIKSAVYGGTLAMKLVEKQDADEDDRDNQIEERLREMETSLTDKQNENFDILQEDIEGDIYDTATEAAENLLLSTKFAEAISNAVVQNPEIICDEEMIEMMKFVRRQMKVAKDAPESSQDVIREHEAEIGFEGSVY
ncbi:hypothetical protein KCU77_g8730, partial [Aureobasidium melanogenum]